MSLKLLFIIFSHLIIPIYTLIPPKFQWKVMDFTWASLEKERALKTGAYIPQNNMPNGLARWRDKLFITIPRWKKGVPSSLNFVYLNGSQSELLQPYPSWTEGYVDDDVCCIKHNSTVVSAFRPYVDKCDRLWVVDNGVTDMIGNVKQLTLPALFVFDLQKDTLIQKYQFGDELRESSVLPNVVVDVISKDCKISYAYISDMGSNAVIVYSLENNNAWRVEHPYFDCDPQAGIFRVGGIDFYWNNGVSSLTLSNPGSDGFRDLFFHPIASTKLFKMSTRVLRDKNIFKEEIFEGVKIIGDKGVKSQSTAMDYYADGNILFYTQLNKNGIGCWNLEKPFVEENCPVIISDCHLMEFPNDVKVDHDGNLWMLSDRQSRFLYSETLDPNQANFRVLTAPIHLLVKDTPCEKMTTFERAMSFIKCRSASGSSKKTSSARSTK